MPCPDADDLAGWEIAAEGDPPRLLLCLPEPTRWWRLAGIGLLTAAAMAVATVCWMLEVT